MGALPVVIGAVLLFYYFSKSAQAGGFVERAAPVMTLATGETIAVAKRTTRSVVVPAGSIQTGGLGRPVSAALILNAGVVLKQGMIFGSKRYKILKVGDGEFVNKFIGGIGPWPVGSEIWSFELKKVLTMTDQGEGPTVTYRWIAA